MISGEVRLTTTGGIGAISLSHLHAKVSVVPHTPVSNINIVYMHNVWQMCYFPG
jgi:hypothetical protein